MSKLLEMVEDRRKTKLKGWRCQEQWALTMITIGNHHIGTSIKSLESQIIWDDPGMPVDSSKFWKINN